ncbi:hypothetical protein D3C86_1763970 [compost metagenome]
MRGISTGVITRPITAGPVQQGNQQLIIIIAPGFSLANIGDAFFISNTQPDQRRGPVYKLAYHPAVNALDHPALLTGRNPRHRQCLAAGTRDTVFVG